ncbi:hypothetical protein N6H18_17645 [Reichenbachiella agarivorans]|uniref:DUF4468 domain-containing protein n=1 Tax=Reichenbachiella agarivorans TaxID=2979464 RepID=A0ABY6CNT1_9BACT|nr:hypothetical protein [Reichenbachiella agarivorans]UXP32166.1 hypothetical protein N6H18_17645 [Reichenbachiella agarivorans]
MKKMITVLSLIVCFQANAQLKLVDGLYQFQKVTEVQRTHAELMEKGEAFVQQRADAYHEEVDRDGNSLSTRIAAEFHSEIHQKTLYFTYTIEFGEGWYQERVEGITIQIGDDIYQLEDATLPDRTFAISEASFVINMLSGSLISEMYSNMFSEQSSLVDAQFPRK